MHLRTYCDINQKIYESVDKKKKFIIILILIMLYVMHKYIPRRYIYIYSINFPLLVPPPLCFVF